MAVIQVTQELYDAAVAVAQEYARVYDKVWDTPSVNPGASSIKWSKGLYPKTMKNVNSVYIHDLFLCMHRMGYTFSMSCAESVAVFLCLNHVLEPDFLATLTFQNIEHRMQTIGQEEAKIANFKPDTIYFVGADHYEFSLVALLMQCNEQALAAAYLEVMHRLCSHMHQVHGTASKQAKEWHATILDDWTRQLHTKLELKHEYQHENTQVHLDPRDLIDTDLCRVVKQGELSVLSPGMRYTIYETPEGEIYGETATCQFRIASSMQDFQQITADKLERIIYNADQSIAR